MLLCLGDSKTRTGNTWPDLLRINCNAEGLPGQHMPSRFVLAEGGYKISDAVSVYVPQLLQMHRPWKNAFINYGANEAIIWNSIPTTEAQFKADYLTVIDALIAMAPAIRIFVARVWVRDYLTHLGEINEWIESLPALRPSNVFLGHDERVWLEGGDNGATMTTDGTHLSAQGQIQCDIECRAKWRAVVLA